MEQAEPLALGFTGEPVEMDMIFAHMRFDKQAGGPADFGQAAERFGAGINEIPDAAHIDDDRIVSERVDNSTEVSDHVASCVSLAGEDGIGIEDFARRDKGCVWGSSEP